MAILLNRSTYSLFKQLAQVRFNEAKLLLSKRKYHGAYYLSGYSIEFAIKAYYCKKVKKFSFPPKLDIVRDLYTHDLNKLLNISELKIVLENEIRTNPIIQSNWSIVKEWSEESRYTTIPQSESIAMLNAVEVIFNWIQTKW